MVKKKDEIPDEINKELTKISESHYATLIEIEEQLQIENKKLEVISNSGATKDAFAMEGWAPKSKLEQIEATLKKFTDSVTIYKLKTEDKPPTLMSNHQNSDYLKHSFDFIHYRKAKNLIQLWCSH